MVAFDAVLQGDVEIESAGDDEQGGADVDDLFPTSVDGCAEVLVGVFGKGGVGGGEQGESDVEGTADGDDDGQDVNPTA